MPSFPTDITTERGHMHILPVSMSNAVNMVSAHHTATVPTAHYPPSLLKNSLGTRIGYDFTCAQPASQLAHKSQNEGLISADRSSKSTLLLTIPRSILSRLQRIYHKGSSSLIAGADRRALLPLVGHLARDVWGVSPYSYSPTIPRGKYCCVLAWILT